MFLAPGLDEPFDVKLMAAMSAPNCWKTALVTEIAAKFGVEILRGAKGTFKRRQYPFDFF